MAECTKCPVCDGSRFLPDYGRPSTAAPAFCHACNGSGVLWSPAEMPTAVEDDLRQCISKLEENMKTEKDNSKNVNLFDSLLAGPKVTTSQRILKGVTNVLIYTLAWTAMIVGIVSLARCAL